MVRRGSIWINIDWITILLYLVLVFLGWVNIYASASGSDQHGILNISSRYGKQLIWIALGIAIAIITLMVDSRFYVIFAYGFYGFFIALLIAVSLWGVEVNNSKAWFKIGGFAFQPSEMSKVAVNLVIAKYIGQYNFKMHKPKSLLALLSFMMIPMVVLVVGQNDTGSALVYASFFIVLYREGFSEIFMFWGVVIIALFILAILWSEQQLLIFLLAISLLIYGIVSRHGVKRVLKVTAIVVISLAVPLVINELYDLGWSAYTVSIYIVVVLTIVFVVYAIKQKSKPTWWIVLFFYSSLGIATSVDYVYDNVLIAHQRNRIDELLGISSDPLGTGYNVNQSKIAIGSGGVMGKGFLQGTQTKYNFIPEQSTDFIFCTVGEEWGFIGAFIVIALFMTLLLRLLFLAERQRSPFGRAYGYGVASILFFHFAINIGMTVGLAPVIGIPLPFFSYGGSSLWGFTILIFILLRLDVSRMDIILR